MEKGKRYRTLYVLPVEAGDGQRYGDGLRAVQAADLHNKYRLICVFPTFASLPWYVDHPTDPRSQQESYLLEDVIPLVERSYPTLGVAAGRFLVGFSKSGWGAFSLLLRHSDTFAIAGAWDAPLTQARPDKFGMRGPFGTQANFEGYRITSLLRKRADLLRERRRLVLTGYGGFRSDHEAVHVAMRKLKVRHVYRDGPKRKHVWGSGWLPEIVELMLRPVPSIGGVEVPEIMRRLGAQGHEEDARRIFQSLDADSDGKLTESEFRKSGRLSDAKLARAVYGSLDTDGDQRVEAPEFVLAWTKWASVD